MWKFIMIAMFYSPNGQLLQEFPTPITVNTEKACLDLKKKNTVTKKNVVKNGKKYLMEVKTDCQPDGDPPAPTVTAATPAPAQAPAPASPPAAATTGPRVIPLYKLPEGQAPAEPAKPAAPTAAATPAAPPAKPGPTRMRDPLAIPRDDPKPPEAAKPAEPPPVQQAEPAPPQPEPAAPAQAAKPAETKPVEAARPAPRPEPPVTQATAPSPRVSSRPAPAAAPVPAPVQRAAPEPRVITGPREMDERPSREAERAPRPPRDIPRAAPRQRAEREYEPRGRDDFGPPYGERDDYRERRFYRRPEPGPGLLPEAPDAAQNFPTGGFFTEAPPRPRRDYRRYDRRDDDDEDDADDWRRRW